MQALEASCCEMYGEGALVCVWGYRVYVAVTWGYRDTGIKENGSYNNILGQRLSQVQFFGGGVMEQYRPPNSR